MHLLALRTVLVATDLDSGSSSAIQTGHALAKAAGATLHVVHVTNEGSKPATLESVYAFIGGCGVELDVRHIHLLYGDAAHAIRLMADRLNADAIVLGPHRGDADARPAGPLGSTALAIVTDSFTPCLVTRTPLRVPLARVLVGVDRSDTARGALVVGLSWASGLRAPAATERGASSTMLVLHVDCATPPAGRPGMSGSPERSALLEREVQRIRADAGDWAEVSVEPITISADDPASAIADAATERRVDLIVVGTHGLGPQVARRLGSVSASLVRNSQIPVLLVPPAVWMSHARSQEILTVG